MLSYQIGQVLASSMHLGRYMWPAFHRCFSDGASSNRSFYKMHRHLSTKNIFNPRRYMWFFVDALHLMKTTRNCLYYSSRGKHARLLWNNGKLIVRKNFIKVAEDQVSLKFMVKLTDEHIRLHSYPSIRLRVRVWATFYNQSTQSPMLLRNYV